MRNKQMSRMGISLVNPYFCRNSYNQLMGWRVILLLEE